MMEAVDEVTGPLSAGHVRIEKRRPHRGSNTGQHDLQSYALTTELWSLLGYGNICYLVSTLPGSMIGRACSKVRVTFR